MTSTGERKYPLKQPPNYKAPVTRWMLRFPPGVSHVYTLYVGVQSHKDDIGAAVRAESAVREWLEEGEGRPAAVDSLRVTEGYDNVDARVWAAYWTDAESFAANGQRDLLQMWRGLEDERHTIGLWTERFVTPIERLETNYARTDHKPGVSQLRGCKEVEHDLSAYWGAGRDRIPASGQDLFERPKDLVSAPSEPRGPGERLSGSNYDNMCHIRSGQWWEKCDDEERRAYEDDLQVKLMAGMRHLWQHPQETGTIGLRFLQNVDGQGRPMKETCGAGFFRNWADLEKWSSEDPSHLAIFKGAHKHAQRFGEGRKFMTWHEVSILKAGEVEFDYVNCAPSTGVIRWVPLTRATLS